MLNFLKNIGKLFIGLPCAICAGVVLGTLGFSLKLASLSQAHFFKGKKGRTGMTGGESLRALSDAVLGGAIWGFKQSLSIVTDPIESYGYYTGKSYTLDNNPEIPSNIVIPGESAKEESNSKGSKSKKQPTEKTKLLEGERRPGTDNVKNKAFKKVESSTRSRAPS